MARPRKLGPTITFRLPIELHQIVADLAEARGETVNQYVARRFTTAVTAKKAATPTGKRAPTITTSDTAKHAVTHVESEHETVTIDIDEPADDFGDNDPEDARDDLDPFRARLALLERIIDNIREHRDDRFELRLRLALELLQAMIREHREDSERLDRIDAALNKLQQED